MRQPFFGLDERLRAVQRGYAGETLALFAALALTLMLVGWLLGQAMGVIVALAVAFITTQVLANLNTDQLMRMQGAVPLASWQAPGLHRLLATLARRAELAANPRLYLLPQAIPNAFTVGEADHAAIGVSRGLLSELGQRELQGVIAHELGHLQAGDTRVMRIAGALVHTTRTVGQVGLITCALAALFGEPIPLVLPLLFFGAPAVALALQLWLSRRREFAADAAAVALTGDAYGLASALVRLDRWRSRLRYLGYALGTPPSWLSSHPPTRERLERLQELQPEAFLPPAPRRSIWMWAL
ncbi:MAG: zinc metalloprotease HtpX [Alphaproteobacteria bacterium]